MGSIGSCGDDERIRIR